jgi:hypothetical protein
MNKISFYILLIIIFLGLSKSFAPSEINTDYVFSEKALPGLFQGEPISIILIDSFQTGFLIKTYYHKYRVIGADAIKNQVYDTIIVRTSQDFWKKNIPNLGMSLFSRDLNNRVSTTPLPPGSIFIGNPSYGGWEMIDDQKVWIFYKSYASNTTHIFSWGDFIPSHDFYQRMKVFADQNRPFYGMNNEFGTNGSITKLYFKKNQKIAEKLSRLFKTHLKSYFKVPPFREKTPPSPEVDEA